MYTLTVAKELYEQYHDMYGKSMDEMKMHKLMYFTQRESLMYDNEPLFDEPFYGWKYGPVLKSVRREYKKGSTPFTDVSRSDSKKLKDLVASVLKRYGGYSSWKLSELSHAEFSWKESRKGLRLEDNGDVQLSMPAMRVDAVRELSFRNKER